MLDTVWIIVIILGVGLFLGSLALLVRMNRESRYEGETQDITYINEDGDEVTVTVRASVAAALLTMNTPNYDERNPIYTQEQYNAAVAQANINDAAIAAQERAEQSGLGRATDRTSVVRRASAAAASASLAHRRQSIIESAQLDALRRAQEEAALQNVLPSRRPGIVSTTRSTGPMFAAPVAPGDVLSNFGGPGLTSRKERRGVADDAVPGAGAGAGAGAGTGLFTGISDSNRHLGNLGLGDRVVPLAGDATVGREDIGALAASAPPDAPPPPRSQFLAPSSRRRGAVAPARNPVVSSYRGRGEATRYRIRDLRGGRAIEGQKSLTLDVYRGERPSGPVPRDATLPDGIALTLAQKRAVARIEKMIKQTAPNGVGGDRQRAAYAVVAALNKELKDQFDAYTTRAEEEDLARKLALPPAMPLTPPQEASSTDAALSPDGTVGNLFRSAVTTRHVPVTVYTPATGLKEKDAATRPPAQPLL